MSKTLKEKIEVMQAALDGKEIEAKYTNRNDTWDVQCAGFAWDWSIFDYRIKPEPMEFWVNVYEPNTRLCFGCHETKDGANSHRLPDCIKTIKVREVIE